MPRRGLGRGLPARARFSPQRDELDRLLLDGLLQAGDLRPRGRQLGVLRTAAIAPTRPRLRQRRKRALAPDAADPHDRRRVDAPLLGRLALRQLARQQLLPDLVLLLRAERPLAPPVATGILGLRHGAPWARLTARQDSSTPNEMA